MCLRFHMDFDSNNLSKESKILSFHVYLIIGEILVYIGLETSLTLDDKVKNLLSILDKLANP